ncbi:MAG: ribosome rescue protein RqcH [Thermofilaceae archaeon]
MKASLTALDFAALLREGLATVEGLRLQKAWWVGGGLALRLREPMAGERVLVLNPSIGVYETRFELPRGELPAQLAAALRGLRGMRLECVRQLNMDRAASLTFERGERRVELVVEWVREGNVLVVEGGRIAAALRQREMRDRRVIIGEVYQPPPPRGLDPLSLTPLDAAPPPRPGLTAAAHLSRLVNAPGEVVAEALHRAGLNPLEDAARLGPDGLWRAMRELAAIYLRVLRGELEPRVALKEGEAVAAYPIELEHLAEPLEPAGSFAEAVDRVFTPRLLQQPEPRVGGAAEAERLAREFAERAALLRRAGERLMADSARIEGILEAFRSLRSSLRWDLVAAELRSKYPEVVDADPARGRVKLLVEGVEVELDAALSAARNASLLFDRAKELERKAERAAEVAAEIKPRVQQPVLKLRRERRWYESFHHFTSSEGFLVIGGRDASQNEAIVRKYLEPRDIFLHADIHGGPAVVVKSGGRQVGEATLREAAQLAASYSRAWELGLASVDVYWVVGEQVSKKAPAGEYLGTGAFMVYGRRNYIRGVKLELAVGVRVSDGSYDLLAGPPSALERECEALVVLEPGRVPREEAAGKIAEQLSSALRAKGLRARIPRHAVLQLLPRGGFYIARVRGSVDGRPPVL